MAMNLMTTMTTATLAETAVTATRLPVWLRVERGRPADLEIAALVAVLHARSVSPSHDADANTNAAPPGLSWRGQLRGYCPPVSWRRPGLREAA